MKDLQEAIKESTDELNATIADQTELISSREDILRQGNCELHGKFSFWEHNSCPECQEENDYV